MSTEEIICRNLDFLLKEYGFIFKCNTNGKQTWCYFSNKYGSVNWYEFPEFNEFELSITISGYRKIILDSHMKLDNTPLKIKHSNIFFSFFQDSRKKYWKEIAVSFEHQIESTHTIFGLKVDKCI